MESWKNRELEQVIFEKIMDKRFPELMMETNPDSILSRTKTSDSPIGLNKEWKKQETIAHLREALENQKQSGSLKTARDLKKQKLQWNKTKSRSPSKDGRWLRADFSLVRAETK